METRKVQQVGGGTYTVSIPISWAESHGIEAGGTAYLYTHRDGSLVVRWGEREDTALASVDVDVGDGNDVGDDDDAGDDDDVGDGNDDDAGDDDDVGDDDDAGDDNDAGDVAAHRLLDAAYTAGFEQITLRATDGFSDTQRESITARARTLIGVDVVAESDSELTVRWLLDRNDLSVHQSVRQLRFVAASMHDAAMATFTGATAEAGYIVDRTDEAERLARLIERQFTRAMVSFDELERLDTTRARLFVQYRVAHELERLATDAAEIARAVQRAGPADSTDLAADIHAAGVAAREAVEAATDAALDGGSAASVHSALDNAAAVRGETRRLLHAVVAEDVPNPVMLTRVLGRLRATALHAETVGEIALQTTVQP